MQVFDVTSRCWWRWFIGSSQTLRLRGWWRKLRRTFPWSWISWMKATMRRRFPRCWPTSHFWRSDLIFWNHPVLPMFWGCLHPHCPALCSRPVTWTRTWLWQFASLICVRDLRRKVQFWESPLWVNRRGSRWICHQVHQRGCSEAPGGFGFRGARCRIYLPAELCFMVTELLTWSPGLQGTRWAARR